MHLKYIVTEVLKRHIEVTSRGKCPGKVIASSGRSLSRKYRIPGLADICCFCVSWAKKVNLRKKGSSTERGRASETHRRSDTTAEKLQEKDR